jgi:hypothetical protein
MSSRKNPQLSGNRHLEIAIVRLKNGHGSGEDFRLFAAAIEDMAEKATENVGRAIGEIGQRAVGVMAALRMVSAMIRDADGQEEKSKEEKDAAARAFLAGIFGDRALEDLA